MAGTHYLFKIDKRNGKLSLMNIAQTIHEAKAIKKYHVDEKKKDPSSILIMEVVG
jgi:anti-sigma-K factor RskA